MGSMKSGSRRTVLAATGLGLLVLAFIAFAGLAFKLFSFKRLNTFSIITIELSTNSPIAIARPPRVITFIVMSMRLNIIIVDTNDMGIAINVISEARKLIKTKTITITTRIAPSLNASTTLLIEELMKVLC